MIKQNSKIQRYTKKYLQKFSTAKYNTQNKKEKIQKIQENQISPIRNFPKLFSLHFLSLPLTLENFAAKVKRGSVNRKGDRSQKFETLELSSSLNVFEGRRERRGAALFAPSFIHDGKSWSRSRLRRYNAIIQRLSPWRRQVTRSRPRSRVIRSCENPPPPSTPSIMQRPR